jgi:hypothetical protein
MKKSKKLNVNVPWGDTKAREIDRQRPARAKDIKDYKERMKRKSAEELEADPRTTGAIEAIKRAILGKKKGK